VANVGRPVQKRIDPRSVDSRSVNSRSVGTKSGRPGGKLPRVVVRKATARDWIGGARLRTLPLAIAPVALGTGAAHLLSDGGWHWVRALLALAVAVFLQIGVNFANDYSDGVRGTDKNRVGPSRLTGSGAAKPRTVLIVALVFFGLGGLAGLALTITSGYYWLLAVGAVCIAAAYFYTGGKRPYGYNGLGEVFVFVFFGLVATAGTTFTQVGTVNVESWLGGVAAGLFACGVLMVNNIRDIAQDTLSGKRTLAVLVGSRAARILFAVFVMVPYLILIFFSIFYGKAPLVYFSLLSGLPAVVITLTGRTAAEFILALKLTSFTALVFGVALGAAIAF
jgi:1,4-dihydroxy-2-naphthoate octaprenyltransferase